MRAGIVALLVGAAVAVVVLATDALLGARTGAPLWTCVSSAPPAAIRVPPRSSELSDRTIEELQSYTECRDRVGVPLVLVAFVTSAVVTYRRASRQ